MALSKKEKEALKKRIDDELDDDQRDALREIFVSSDDDGSLMDEIKKIGERLTALEKDKKEPTKKKGLGAIFNLD